MSNAACASAVAWDGGRTLKAHDYCHGIALRKREDKRGVKQLGQSNGDVAVNPQVLDALIKVAERSRKLVDLYAERIKMDDGYQVIDPRTVANAFQELAAKAA